MRWRLPRRVSRSKIIGVPGEVIGILTHSLAREGGEVPSSVHARVPTRRREWEGSTARRCAKTSPRARPGPQWPSGRRYAPSPSNAPGRATTRRGTRNRKKNRCDIFWTQAVTQVSIREETRTLAPSIAIPTVVWAREIQDQKTKRHGKEMPVAVT